MGDYDKSINLIMRDKLIIKLWVTGQIVLGLAIKCYSDLTMTDLLMLS